MKTLKHLIYKEWLKTRWFASIALLLNLGVLIYIFIALRSNFLSAGGTIYLSTLMTYKTQFFFPVSLHSLRNSPAHRTFTICSGNNRQTNQTGFASSPTQPANHLYHGRLRLCATVSDHDTGNSDFYRLNLRLSAGRNHNPGPSNHVAVAAGRLLCLFPDCHHCPGTGMEIPFPVYLDQLQSINPLFHVFIHRKCSQPVAGPLSDYRLIRHSSGLHLIPIQ